MRNSDNATIGYVNRLRGKKMVQPLVVDVNHQRCTVAHQCHVFHQTLLENVRSKKDGSQF